MNAFRHSAVLAALLVILAFHADATPGGTVVTSTCSIVVPTASSQTYNNWTQICCPTGVKTLDGSDPAVDCCHDNTAAACPSIMNTGLPANNQTQCCRPDPAWDVNDAVPAFRPRARDCYNPTFQGCCKAQWQRTNTQVMGSVQTYDAEMYQCCSTGTSQPVNNAGAAFQTNGAAVVIVPRGVSSCIQYLGAVKNVYFRCLTDSQCPGNKATGENRGKCCRRPIAPGETTDDYNTNAAGTCIDPKFQDCCAGNVGGAAGNTVNAGTYQYEVIDKEARKCCSIPVWGGGSNSQAYSVGINEQCPCLADTDCGAAGSNFTCCAPQQTQIVSGATGAKRLVQCTGAAGAATDASGNQIDLSRYPGCYGRCVPTGPAGSAANSAAASCLNTQPNFSTRCADLRIENPNAYTGGILNGNLDQPQWITPTYNELIVAENQLHSRDCCPNEFGFSALFNPTTQLCCPIIGSVAATGGLQRRLSPYIPRAQGTLGTTTYSTCLCNANADCQSGYTCCTGAASWFGSNSAAHKHQINYARPDGTLVTGICINANTTSCCNIRDQDPSSLANPSPFITRAVPFDPTAAVCCAVGGVKSTIGECGCHTDADCPGEFGSCCLANTVFGSGTHAFGTCYDRRRQSCCTYHTTSANVPATEAVVQFAAVYDNTTQVCCPWGGLQDIISVGTSCKCRSDATADCPTYAPKCCSSTRKATDRSTPYRSEGVCYNPAKSQGCCEYGISKTINAVALYDTNKQVCCAVNGVAKDHRSCRCTGDSHCPANGQCCVDAQFAASGFNLDCSDWTSSTDNKRCPGTCIHKEIETCCDNPYISEWQSLSINSATAVPVAVCKSQYEKCCDGQCCNKAVASCKKTSLNRNVGGVGFPSAYTGLSTSAGYHYGLSDTAKVCTVVEHSSPSIVFHSWVFPAFLSVASIIVICLGSRAGLSAEFGSNINRLVLVGVQVFVGIMSLLLLWSPLWKYGFGIVFANSFILHSFVVGGTWTRRIAVILIVVTFLWVYEPFGTNYILSFGTKTFAKNLNGHYVESLEIHGLNYAARTLQRDRDDIDANNDNCVKFYQYWQVDSELHDDRSWNPKSTTRGICRRSWMHTIVVMAGLIMPFEAVWLFLASIALARASSATKDVKVQPIQA